MLFNLIDTQVGSSIGTEDPAETLAAIDNSTVHVAGDVEVSADNTAAIEATVDNESTSAASALFGATGMSVSGVLAGNMVSSGAEARIGHDWDYVSTDTPATMSVGDRIRLASGAVYQRTGSALQATLDLSDITQGYAASGDWTLRPTTAIDGVRVSASDDATIDAASRMVSSSATSNDGGASILNGFASRLLDDYQFTSISTRRTISIPTCGTRSTRPASAMSWTVCRCR